MVTKKFTILHSNDMHGDFLAEQIPGTEGMIGGLSLLSGYINSVRNTEKNVLYTISGDMVQGSIIDAEYKGISTIEIINYLSPDVVSLGNHELDYGLPHLLFLEKMANFPLVNANMYIKKYHKRLMRPYFIKKIDDFDILFIGIITESVLDSLYRDKNIGILIDLEDAAQEIGRICDTYKTEDIDLTVILSHIGFESDIQLAKMLDPEWGVDLILGGHSHTYLTEPAMVNHILIAQAGCGTDQIGRFDVLVDDDTNSITEWKWQLVPINNTVCSPDPDLQKFIDSYKNMVDEKNGKMLCRFIRKLDNEKREVETPLGDLFADILAQNAGCDIGFVGSGSIRVKELGPLVTMGDLISAFPYEDSYQKFTIAGLQLKKIFAHIMRPENRNHEGECYQVSNGVQAIYSDSKHDLVSLKLNGSEVDNDNEYSIGIQGFHFDNAQNYLNISQKELMSIRGTKVTATKVQSVIEEYFRYNQNISSEIEGRLICTC